ncbi:MAG: hypothetical protein ACRECR_01745 [Thermoplasmata archaeon]
MESFRIPPPPRGGLFGSVMRRLGRAPRGPTLLSLLEPAEKPTQAHAPVPPPPGPAPDPAASFPASVPAPAPAVAGNCPSCQVPYLPTGAAGRFGCPLCGAHLGPAASAPGAPPSRPDRAREELLAAWMLGRPLPCPKCRTPLKRAGPAEFRCTGCSGRVAFPELATSAAGAARPPQ